MRRWSNILKICHKKTFKILMPHPPPLVISASIRARALKNKNYVQLPKNSTVSQSKSYFVPFTHLFANLQTPHLTLHKGKNSLQKILVSE